MYFDGFPPAAGEQKNDIQGHFFSFEITTKEIKVYYFLNM
jgi:hypothetical protein